MSKAIFEIFKRQFDEHFNRELVLCIAFQKADEAKLLTTREIAMLNDFMFKHPHAKISAKALQKEGLTVGKAMKNDLRKLKRMNDKELRK